MVTQVPQDITSNKDIISNQDIISKATTVPAGPPTTGTAAIIDGRYLKFLRSLADAMQPWAITVWGCLTSGRRKPWIDVVWVDAKWLRPTRFLKCASPEFADVT